MYVFSTGKPIFSGNQKSPFPFGGCVAIQKLAVIPAQAGIQHEVKSMISILGSGFRRNDDIPFRITRQPLTREGGEPE